MYWSDAGGRRWQSIMHRMVTDFPRAAWSQVVSFTGERKRPGTAFVVGGVDDQLLVTARHLCLDEPEEVVLLRHPWTNNGFAFQAPLERVGMQIATNADFAIFRMGRFAIPLPDNNIPLDPHLIGFPQPAYILGYPYGFRTQTGNSPQHLPMVKGCTTAGMAWEDGGTKFVYIDAMVNPGFSGGPLLFQHEMSGEWRFAGVVSGALSGPLDEPTDEVPNSPRGPAGIGIVVVGDAFKEIFQELHGRSP